MGEQILTIQEVKGLINKIGPSLGCGDFTYEPVFPEGREDVAAIRRMAEDGREYGYDTIYLVWKKGGEVFYREIANSRATKDYIHIRSVSLRDDGAVRVDFGSGGSYSGKPWDDSATLNV